MRLHHFGEGLYAPETRLTGRNGFTSVRSVARAAFPLHLHFLQTMFLLAEYCEATKCGLLLESMLPADMS